MIGFQQCVLVSSPFEDVAPTLKTAAIVVAVCCFLNGRQRKRWEDNIKEWTGLEWNIILRGVEEVNLVVKSSVLPQRSVRLRDR